MGPCRTHRAGNPARAAVLTAFPRPSWGTLGSSPQSQTSVCSQGGEGWCHPKDVLGRGGEHTRGARVGLARVGQGGVRRGPCCAFNQPPGPATWKLVFSLRDPHEMSPSPTVQSCLTPPGAPASALPQPPRLQAGPALGAWHFLAPLPVLPLGAESRSMPCFSRSRLWALCISNTVLLEKCRFPGQIPAPPFLANRVTCNRLPQEMRHGVPRDQRLG